MFFIRFVLCSKRVVKVTMYCSVSLVTFFLVTARRAAAATLVQAHWVLRKNRHAPVVLAVLQVLVAALLLIFHGVILVKKVTLFILSVSIQLAHILQLKIVVVT